MFREIQNPLINSIYPSQRDSHLFECLCRIPLLHFCCVMRSLCGRSFVKNVPKGVKMWQLVCNKNLKHLDCALNKAKVDLLYTAMSPSSEDHIPSLRELVNTSTESNKTHRIERTALGWSTAKNKELIVVSLQRLLALLRQPWHGILLPATSEAHWGQESACYVLQDVLALLASRNCRQGWAGQNPWWHCSWRTGSG